MNFNNLNLNNALRNALEDLGFEAATPIQAEAYPVIASGRDVVGIAQTGTGKTFAYLLPVLRNLKFSKQKHPRVLIVVPTRELVDQVVGEVEKLNAYSSLRVKGAYGGVNMSTQAVELKEGMDILVATPGRLVDLALSRAVKLKTIKQLVIDEVDEMLNLGFRKQLSDIFELLPERRQNILFSATMTEAVATLIDAVFEEPVKIEIAASGTSAEGISQYCYRVPNFKTKLPLLHYLLVTAKDWDKVLIFAPSKRVADELFDYLEPEVAEPIGVIHSNKSQNYRIRTVEAFDKGTCRVLIATDLMARGLDFEGITHVLSLDTPEDAERYIHRIGRTARASATGVAITFVSEQPVTKELEYFEAIEALQGIQIDVLPFPEEVGIIEELIEDEILTYRQKNAQKELDILKTSQGAFQDKKLKNTKVNRAQEKRLARKREKLNSKRRGPKK